MSLPSQQDVEQLVRAAFEARTLAYAPYSKFLVGAAIRSKDGKIFAGCNIENCSYGLTICAERVALFKAVSEGSKNFEAIALVTDSEVPVMPCGACRQVLSEFNPNMIVVSGTVNGRSVMKIVSELLPEPFSKNKFY
jgi:cytidine deaminase